MPTELSPDDFWSRLDGVQAGMLSLDGARPVPMSHYADRDAGTIWFITAEGTDMVSALKGGPAQARYIVASGSDKLYARIDGTATLVTDPAKLDELWNPIAGAWFEGERDPDVRLVGVVLSEAEVWATDGGLKFFWEIAKAHATDSHPDMGEHGTIRFG